MAIITTDTDGDIRSFSAGASGLTGWDEGEVVSRPAAVLFEENAYKDLLPKLARRSLRTQGVTTRSTMVRRDGSTFQAEVIVRMLMGSSSQPVGFMMLVRDITEQIRTENELRDSERRYRGLIESLSEGVIIVKEGRIVYANPAAEALCGGTGATLLGSVLREHVATGDVLVVQSALESLAIGASTGTELTFRLLGPDGLERAEVRVMSVAVEFAGGTAAMLLMQDESATRRVEEELRHNETRLDAVLEATSDGVLVISEAPDARVRMTNRAFAELFDLTLDTLLGASVEDLTELLRDAGPGGAAVAQRIEQRTEADAPGSIPLAGRAWAGWSSVET
jgi:PAS domain S-box-containing protein